MTTGPGDGTPGGDRVKIVRRILADGTVREYRYSRAPRKPRPSPGALRGIFNAYSASPEFLRLAPSSRQTYSICLRLLEDELGWMTRADLERHKARTEFYAMRDRHRDRPSMADMMTRILGVVLAWAYDSGRLAINHAHRMRQLVEDRNPRSERIYTEADEVRLLAELPQELRQAFRLALFTGLRRGDLCALSPASIRNGWLVVVPQKTARAKGTPVHLPVYEFPPLNDLLREIPPDALRLLLRDDGSPWQPGTLTTCWSRAMDRIGIDDMHFHDVRGTLATRLISAGCTEAERGAIMGHALAAGSGAAYTARVRDLSINAYRKLWASMQRGPVVVAWKTAAGK